ncbi:MAG TPA: ATP-binding protein, partial [Lysobacter sp.]|nr:ATP-binding protein [Lysobacter sp.]
MRIYLTMLASMIAFGVFFGIAYFIWHLYYVSGHRPGVLVIVILLFLALALAIGAIPIARRLTGRLERLQRSVDALGAGQLSTRVAVEGQDEVASLATSFNRSAARIEALVEGQKTLLSNASHELRSPLARIRMGIELMREQASPDVRLELMRNMAELDGLIEEILLASRLDAVPDGAVNREPIDLTALAAEECAAVDARLDATAVSLRGDSRLLSRMLRNQLENAQRYGDGTPILVRLGTDSDQAIRMDVIDRGPGIPAVERENIFTPFYRLPGISERAGGVGLGLCLVRQFGTALVG